MIASRSFDDLANAVRRYRTLGFHTVLSVAAGLPNNPTAEGLCDTARATLAGMAAARISSPRVEESSAVGA